MDNIVSRFLTFEETLGRGLVKFAYFVILIGLVVWAVVEIAGGVILLFDRPLAGLWEIVHTPFEFALWAMLLRVATELVLAILSIDDNLAETALTGRGQDAPAPRVAESTAPVSAPTPTPAKTGPPADAPASSPASAPTSSSSASGSAATSTASKPAAKTAKRTPAKTTKKATKKTAKSSPSTQATVKAASSSPASARSDAGKSGGGDGGGQAS